MSAVCLRVFLRVGMCMCECVAVSVGVVCQAWVEAMMGKIQLGGPGGCQYKYNFLVLFFLEDEVSPKNQGQNWGGGRGPHPQN